MSLPARTGELEVARMSSASQVATAAPALSAVRWKQGLRRYFYLFMMLVCAVVLVWGFGHTVEPVLLHPAIPRPKILWVHAAVFSAWLLFAILQSVLVRVHKVKVHRILGWAGTGLAAAMVVIGTMTAIQLGRFDVTVLHQAGADTFEIVSFADMILFPLLVTLAIVKRRNVELHRRLFLLATIELTAAGFGRIDWIFAHNLMFFCADTLMCLGILRDWLLDHRVHRVYKVGIPAIVVWHGWVTWMYLRPPAWWAHLAHKMMS
jgi:hypothetical protein